ncbi:MAG: hypothetical protein ACFFFH_12380 [Candidatus Thorarchaeota archaeon]
MSKEVQLIELVNPKVNKIMVGAGLGLILVGLILIIVRYSFSEYTQPIEIILEFGIYFLGPFGGVLIGIGIGQKYRSQWIKKRE